MKKIIFLLISTLSFTSSANDLFKGKWIDLTHNFSKETIYWPTAESFKKETVFEGETDEGFYYTAYKYSAEEHGGTHIDAPIHFVKNRKTVDQIPIEQLIAPGVVIRIADKIKDHRNYQLSIKDILDWEQQHGVIADNSIVLINTGSGKLWPDRKKYMGTDERGKEAVEKLAFPGIHPDAAQFLATKRKINAVGIDSPSIDFGGSKQFRTHRILFDKNIPGLENIANLDQLPPKDFIIFALPMKIKGGSGSPLRIVAFIPNR